MNVTHSSARSAPGKSRALRRGAIIHRLACVLLSRSIVFSAVLVALCLASSTSRADVGLIIETPTGMLGFLSNVGHVSVWISRGCLDASGHIVFCEGTAGLVLTSTAYWPNPGAAAIPAELFFLGTQPGVAGRNRAAWIATLADRYPEVAPAVGAKYLGRSWLRSLRVLKFRTSAEDDRRVLAEVDAVQREYQYSYSHRNCAFYAQTVLQRYLGSEFHGNRVLELGIDTPRAVERALQRRLEEESVEFTIVRFKGDIRHAWRQPSRNICESAIFDPKYAVPLLLYEPYLYAGFAGCYTAVRIAAWARKRSTPTRQRDPVSFTEASGENPQLRAFTSLIGLSLAGLHKPILGPPAITSVSGSQASATDDDPATPAYRDQSIPHI